MFDTTEVRGKKNKSDTKHIFQTYIAKSIETGEMLTNTDKSESL